MHSVSADVIDDPDHAALRAAAATGAPICTIVGIDGSFSRRAGAQVAVLPDGTTIGSLSDGCLERELVSQAVLAQASGNSRLLRYGRGSPFIDFRLPCGAGLDILVDPCPNRIALAHAVKCLDARLEARLRLPNTRTDLLQERRYIPSLRMVIFGAGQEVVELGRLARAYGISTAIFEPGEGIALGKSPNDLAVDRWTAIVTLFHDHEWEVALLGWALETPAFYIGAQGGQAARESRKERLLGRGYDERAIQRIANPVGLIPRVRDARAMALSALAEIVARYETLRHEA